jgi:hypothetical protein
MFFINGIPFTFDEITQMQKDDPYVQVEASNNITYTVDDMYRWSNYLIMEEAHPILFEMELANPEEMPRD